MSKRDILFRIFFSSKEDALIILQKFVTVYFNDIMYNYTLLNYKKLT